MLITEKKTMGLSLLVEQGFPTGGTRSTGNVSGGDMSNIQY